MWYQIHICVIKLIGIIYHYSEDKIKIYVQKKCMCLVNNTYSKHFFEAVLLTTISCWHGLKTHGKVTYPGSANYRISAHVKPWHLSMRASPPVNSHGCSPISFLATQPHSMQLLLIVELKTITRIVFQVSHLRMWVEERISLLNKFSYFSVALKCLCNEHKSLYKHSRTAFNPYALLNIHCFTSQDYYYIFLSFSYSAIAFSMILFPPNFKSYTSEILSLFYSIVYLSLCFCIYLYFS